MSETFAQLDHCAENAPSRMELIELTKRCLAFGKKDRPAHAGILAETIAHYQTESQARERRAEVEHAQAKVQLAEERKRVTIERQKRRTVFALLLAVLLLLIGAGAWVFRMQHQRAESRRKHMIAQNNIIEALEKCDKVSAELRTQLAQRGGVFRLLNAPSQWKSKIQAIKGSLRRVSLIQSTAAHPFSPSIHQHILKCKSSQEQHKTAFQLALKIESIREQRARIVDGQFDTRTASEAYETLYRQLRLYPQAGKETAIAKRLESYLIHEQLLAGYDDWSLTLTEGKARKGPLLARVLHIAGLASSHEWGKELRNPQLWSNPASLSRRIQSLPMEQLSPSLIHLLSVVLRARQVDVSSLLREARNHHPSDYWLHLASGYLLMQAHPQESIGCFRAALALRPESAVAWYNLSLILSAEEQPSASIVALRQAVKYDPSFVEAWNNLGATLDEQGKVTEAIAMYRQAVVVNPDHAHSWCNLGNCLQKQKQYSEAINAFEKAIAAKETYAQPWFNLGFVHSQTNNLEGAIQAYRKGLALDDTNAIVWNNYGYALYQKKKYQEAIKAYDRALRLNPFYFRANQNRRLAKKQLR